MNDVWLSSSGCETEKNCYFRAVKLLNDERPTTIDIAAESYYILYVNGRTVGQGPARGTRRQNYFDTFEVSEYLIPGRNVIALLVQCMNIPTFMAVPSQPTFMIRFDGQPQHAEGWRAVVAPDWRKDAPLYTKQTGFAEWRDFRLEPVGWTSGEGAENWPAAVSIPADRAIYSKELLPRDIPCLKETVILPVDMPLKAAVARVDNPNDIEIAKLLTEEKHLALPLARLQGFNDWMVGDRSELTLMPNSDGEGIVLLFDFGAAVIGRFELEIHGSDGAIVDLCHEEELWNDRLQALHPVSAFPIDDSYKFADRYILRDGRQVVGNTINERGFRMVQAVFRNFTEPLVIRSVRAVKAVYPYLNRGTFLCDDFMLNRIWDVCGETLSACSTDIFLDCPWRERAFWVNDLIVENKISLELFGASAIHRRAFHMLFSETRANGLVPGVCPCPDDQGGLIFPATNLFLPLMLRDYLLRSGDLILIRELLPKVVAIFGTFEHWFDADGLIAPPENLWNFFDWSCEMTGVSLNGKKSSLLDYLYLIALKAFVELASLAGLEWDIDKYRSRLEGAGVRLEKIFFKPEDNRLADWVEGSVKSGHSSQLAHALALLSGECSETNRKHLEEALGDQNILIPELYLHFFVFQAMRLCGQEAAALDRIRNYWGPIVESGAPTIWEMGVHGRGKAAISGNASLCHGFATAPVDFLQTAILGVEPLKPGFAEFRLAPTPCGLKFAEGRVPTPTGNIHIRWEAHADELVVDLDVPSGALAVCSDGRTFGAGKHQFALARTK